MKKLVSLILCVIMVCCVGTYFAQADTNYCKLFEDNINILRWGMNGSADVAEGASFPMATIFDNLEMKLAFDYYKEGEDFVNIPADVFEEKAKKCFAVVDVNAMRAYEEDFYNQETDSTDKRKIYDEAQNVYVFPAAGGFGDPSRYVVMGYVESNGKYTVYSYFIDPSEADDTLTGEEGKDYFVYEGQKCKIDHTIKNVVETDGTDVKFHSWEKISAVPEVDGMITPPAQSDGKDPDDTSSNPDTSKPSDSSKPEDSSKPSNSSNPDGSKPDDTSSNPDESQVVTPPLEGNPLVTVFAPQSVKLEAEVNAFPESTIVKVEEIKDGAKLASVKKALSGVAERFVAYEITAQCKNVTVQPNGLVKAIFNIPEDYKTNRVVFYYVSENGVKEEVPSYVNEENRTVVAELPHFSTYVVAETNKPIDAAQAEIEKLKKDENPEDGGSVIWIIIIIVIALGVGGGIAAFFIINKKKSANVKPVKPQNESKPQRKPIKPQHNEGFGFVIVSNDDESETDSSEDNESVNENADSENEDKGKEN